MEVQVEQYHCHRCDGDYDVGDDFPYDYGLHREPQEWQCPKCGGSNLNVTFTCQTCSYELRGSTA
jgi:rubrerythrin